MVVPLVILGPDRQYATNWLPDQEGTGLDHQRPRIAA
jgi:hypothetical protein